MVLHFQLHEKQVQRAELPKKAGLEQFSDLTGEGGLAKKKEGGDFKGC